ncbi:MAG: DegT/DnrJ/EryC1/StrS family aminotransferase [Myxococcota bacterium]
MKIPIMNLGPENAVLAKAVLPRIQSVLEAGDFMLGEEVTRFEEAYAEWNQRRFGIAVNSGTDAIALALRAFGVGPGDEVITAPNTFVGTVGAIIATGATPVLADVGDDENIDPAGIEAAISPRTRAVVPVHLRGRPARMDEIMAIARAHDLIVVEDCAQAHGATFRGRKAGTFGNAGAFSLHPQKILGACGDAGIIVTDNAEAAARMHLLHHHGLANRDDVSCPGVNSRLDTIQATILNEKLKHLDGWVRRRRELAAMYIEALSDLPLQLPTDGPHEQCAYYLFTLQCKERDALQQWLHDRGIDARIHYARPLHLQPAFEGRFGDATKFPRVLRQSSEILSLPLYPSLTEHALQEVCEAVRSFYAQR